MQQLSLGCRGSSGRRGAEARSLAMQEECYNFAVLIHHSSWKSSTVSSPLARPRAREEEEEAGQRGECVRAMAAQLHEAALLRAASSKQHTLQPAHLPGHPAACRAARQRPAASPPRHPPPADRKGGGMHELWGRATARPLAPWPPRLPNRARPPQPSPHATRLHVRPLGCEQDGGRLVAARRRQQQRRGLVVVARIQQLGLGLQQRPDDVDAARGGRAVLLG